MKKLISDPIPNTQQLLEPLLAYSSWWLAYSGGLDSTVLLHWLMNNLPVELRARLTAIHVNHRVSPMADHWAQHCQNTCHAWGVSFIERKLPDHLALAGDSLEEKLRILRYQIFADLLPMQAALLTAHHADDQAETLLLQLLRGAGVNGMASMPMQAIFARGFLVRPLLAYTRAELHAYAKNHHLTWIEDPSNSDVRFSRNYLRQIIFPLLHKKWPGATTTIARASQHLAEARSLLETLASEDLETVTATDPGIPDTDKNITCGSPLPQDYCGIPLNISLLMELNYTRQKNCLRHWLQKMGFKLPSQKKLESLLTNIIAARPDASPYLQWDGVEIRRFRNYLYATPPLNSHDHHKIYNITSLSAAGYAGTLTLMELGIAITLDCTSLGLSLARFQIRFRQGGEKLRLHPQGCTRELKKLFQEWQVPVWQRSRIPLLYLDDQLTAVIGYHCPLWLNDYLHVSKIPFQVGINPF